MTNQCCKEHSLEDIFLVETKLKNRLTKLGESLVSREFYGYGCEKNETKLYEDIALILRSLSRVKNELLHSNESCNCEYLQNFIERAKNYYCDDTYETVIVEDASLKEYYQLRNPNCVPIERYERLAKLVCDDLKITFTADVNKNICDFSYNISLDKISCDLIVGIHFYKEACDLDYKFKYEEQDCKLQYKTIRKLTNCNLTYKAYSDLLKCNLTPSFIFKAYSENCSLKLVNDVPVIVVGSEEFTINNFDTTAFSLDNCDDCDYIQSKVSSEFVNQMKQDYNFSDKDFNAIK